MPPDAWTHAETALELPQVIDLVAAFCETDLGAAELRDTRPSFDRALISPRLQQTGEAVHVLELGETPVYSNARDVGHAVAFAGKGSALPGTELYRVAETLGAMARLRKHVAASRENAPGLWTIAQRLAYLPKLKEEIETAIGPDGDVLDGASATLKAIRARKTSQLRKITERLQSLISGSHRSYLQEALYTQRDGRYVIPVKAQFRGKVPGIVHDSSGSGQTIFVEPEVIVGEMNKLRELEGAEREEVERILADLASKVGHSSEEIIVGLSALAELDAIFAKARYSFAVKGCEPAIEDGHFMSIREGHHPLIERHFSVPLDIDIGGKYKSLIITGPNTGGKTVCLKAIGLYSLMIGCGIFPPAKRVALGPFTGVWADIGDEQSLQQSLSTFGGHLKNIARVFKNASSGALCLFDEVGAGTDPREGAALAKAILTELLNRGAVIGASTHYGELKEFALTNDQSTSAAMEFDLKTLKPTYHLIPGATGSSHAFEISRRYGIPDQVIVIAEEMIGSEGAKDREKSNYLDELIREAREDRAAADAQRMAVASQVQALEKQKQDVREKLETVRSQAEEAVSEAVRDARDKYRRLTEMISALNVSGSEKEVLREEARAIERGLSTARQELKMPREANPEVLSVGMEVGVQGHPHIGKILEIGKSGKVIVQINQLKMAVRADDVSPVNRPSIGKKAAVVRNPSSMSRSENISSELVIRQMRAEDAKDALDRFFDDAALAGLERARIVHGKGDGILRRIVRISLESRKDVAAFGEAPADQGGSGVTVVEFRP